MAWSFVNERITKTLIPVYPGASTVAGFINSSDIGNLCITSSNNGVLPVGTTADFTKNILGIISVVPTATTPGSTVPFYVAPILPGEQIKANFSTTYSTSLPASTDIGKYVGFSNTTTVAGGVLSIGTLSNVKGTTNGAFFRINRVDSDRRELVGIINSSHLSI